MAVLPASLPASPGVALSVRCHVWLRPTQAGAPAPTGASERQRWERLRADADRDRTATGHHLVREAAAWWLGVEADDVELQRRCGRCGASDHGPVAVVTRPGQRDVAVNVSHSGSLVAVALTGGPAVGVDVEALGAQAPGVAAVALSRRERAEHEAVGTTHDLLVRWVRKEAVLKAAGIGLAGNVQAVRVSHPARPARVVSWGRRARPAGVGAVRLADLAAPAGFVGAVAVLTRRRLRVTLHR